MQAAGKRVVYLIDVPEMPVFARDCVQRTSLLPAKSLCSVTLEGVELRQRGIRSVAENLKKALPDLIVMDTVPALCNGTFPCELASSSFSFYEDSQHLSVRGATKVASELLPKIGFSHAAPSSVAWVQ